jgi:hypothetical protein
MNITSNLNQSQTNPAFKAHIVKLNTLANDTKSQIVNSIESEIGKGFVSKLNNEPVSDIFVGMNENEVVIAIERNFNQISSIVTSKLDKILTSLKIKHPNQIVTKDSAPDRIIKFKNLVTVEADNGGDSYTAYNYGKINDVFEHFSTEHI